MVRNAEPKIPTKTLRREDVPTEEQIGRILAVVHPRWQLLLAVPAYGGLRFGEAAALVGDDRSDGGIWVRRAVSETSRGLIVDVKDHEERFVELPTSIVRALDGIEAEPSDRLFSTQRGGLLSVSSFHHQVWARALMRAGIRQRPLKILRAFAASLWLDAGASIEYVRDQL